MSDPRLQAIAAMEQITKTYRDEMWRKHYAGKDKTPKQFYDGGFALGYWAATESVKIELEQLREHTSAE